MRVVDGLDELKALVGTEVAVSDWLRIEQSRIDAFADVTNDHQWIHVDPARAARESPFRAPVAHGFLTLSLLTCLMQQSLRITGFTTLVNYGLNRVRFPAPVIAGCSIRARFAVTEVTEFEGGAQLELQAKVECEGQLKPVCTASLLVRLYL